VIFQPDIGTTYQLGRFLVRIALRPDNPAFACYIVFWKNKLIGKQFSRPNRSDCEWLERQSTEYAPETRWHDVSGNRRYQDPAVRRYGRLSKSEFEALRKAA
jgi:hypothetical protein